MSCVRAVAGREFRALVSSRAYRIGTLAGLAAVAALGLLPQLAGPAGAVPDGAWRTAVEGTAVVADRADVLTPDVLPEVLAGLTTSTGLRWVSWRQQFPDRPLPELGELRRLAAEGRIAAYAVVERPAAGGHGGGELRWVVGGQLDEAGLRAVQRQADRLAAWVRLRAAGVSPEAATWLLAPAQVERDAAGLPARQGWPSGGAALALLFLFVLYVTLVVYGTAVANGIAAEKGGRVVEMLLAAATPEELLKGKLLGMGQAALLQYAVWGSGALAAALATAGPAGAESAGRLAGWAAAAFLLAFAGYTPLFAATGSLAGRPEEVSQTSWLPLGVLVGAYLAAVAAMAAPGGALATGLSLVPLVGPLAMYGRLSATAVPGWQLWLSAAVGVATAAMAWRWAEGVYRRCILQTQRTAWLRWPWRRPRPSARQQALGAVSHSPSASPPLGRGLP